MNPSDISAFWDQRFSSDAFVYGEAPDEYLAAQRHRLRRGMAALVPGDGEGRNGVWLAQQGLDVVTVDIAEEGLRKARGLASRRGVSLTALQANLANWNWPVAHFDVVASIFLHLPPKTRELVHRNMIACIRPGGILIIRAFRPEQLAYRQKFGSTGGPPAPEMLFTAPMLRADLEGAEELELASVDVDMGTSGPHSGLCAIVQGVWRI